VVPLVKGLPAHPTGEGKMDPGQRGSPGWRARRRPGRAAAAIAMADGADRGFTSGSGRASEGGTSPHRGFHPREAVGQAGATARRGQRPEEGEDELVEERPRSAVA
jgi:hypothetical protein